MALSDDIDYFLADRTVQGVIEASRESRPLQICYPREIPVSRFLGWVLDPTQGHGLNAAVIRRLLTACWETATSEAISPKLRKQIAPSRLNMSCRLPMWSSIEKSISTTKPGGWMCCY